MSTVLYFLYRFSDHQTAGPIDEFGDLCGPSTTHVTMLKYPVLKVTPKGAWISVLGQRKFVLLTARKRFACPTKVEAKESFIARKRAQIRIHTSIVNRAETAIQIANRYRILE